MRVLFISPVPLEGAGCRARIMQYLPYLEAVGIHGVVRPFMNAAFFKVAYQPGCWGRKVLYLLLGLLRRVITCLESVRYDVIYVYRECAPIGPPLFEWVLRQLGKPLIYDLDDAIHLPSEQEQFRGRVWRWVKCYSKVPWIVRHCDHAIVGNSYLKGYVQQWTPHVTILPTPEDPARFQEAPRPDADGRLTIGWIGTHSTASYFLQLANILRELSGRYDLRVKVVGAGRPIAIPGVRVESVAWSLAEEARLVQSFDVGVYPLSGSEFDQGKACYKAILYMAAGVPVVASRFGANCDIIQDGVNGFLASSADEWIRRLSQLAEQPDLRARLQDAGRQAVAARYSVAANAPRLIEVIRSAGAAARRPTV